MATVDEAVRRVLRVKFALGLFEHPYARGTEVTRAVDAHRPLARRAAEESFVLLKNGGDGQAPVLPLASSVKKVALIGPLADNAGEMQGAWGGAQHQPDVVTVRGGLEARLKKIGGQLFYAKGTDILGDSEAGFAAAKQAADKADVVVMALGESSSMSGEAGSRAHLDLPGNQQKLLEEITATGKPVVLLVFSGRPLVLDWAAKHVAGDHGGVVPRHRGRLGRRQHAVRRCLAQRPADHELPARGRPGAAVLQPVPDRPPGRRCGPEQAAGGRHALHLALHRRAERRAVSIRLRPELHHVRLFRRAPVAHLGAAGRGRPGRGEGSGHGRPRR